MKLTFALTAPFTLVALTACHGVFGPQNDAEALKYHTSRSAAIVKLGEPTSSEIGSFHHKTLAAEWKPLPPFVANAMVDYAIAPAIAEAAVHSASPIGDPNGDQVNLHPFGPVMYDYGIRLDTDCGRRDFLVSLPHGQWLGYIDAFDASGHSLGIDWNPGTMEGLKLLAPK